MTLYFIISIVLALMFCIRMHFVVSNKILNCDRMLRSCNNRTTEELLEIYNFVVNELPSSCIRAGFRIWDWSNLCSIRKSKRDDFIRLFPGE